jgi:AAA domain
LGWKPDAKVDGEVWRVLYVDGEMHIGDIQERAQLLLDAVPGINRTKATSNLTFLARQQQSAAVSFPEITDASVGGGQDLILQKVLDGKFDLVVLDNFSTLGRVPDENAASSFDDIQAFLLRLKTEQVATLLVHHTGKTTKDGSSTFRGSSKLAATFEIMVRLERYLGDVKQRGRVERPKYDEAHFSVHWDKLRGLRTVGKVIAKLTTKERQGHAVEHWEFTTSLDGLHYVKQALEEGLLINQTEMATCLGRSPPAGKRIVEQGIKYRVWTDANLRAWWANGKKRRKAGETMRPTKEASAAPGMAWAEEDDTEDELGVLDL